MHAFASTTRYEWLLSCGVVAVLAIAGGLAWLAVEHHRVMLHRTQLACGSFRHAAREPVAPGRLDPPVHPNPLPAILTVDG
ncbi:MAG: hypothetical protein K2X97_05290 [Mycobacteriaceae bacterium]|nr:hypothetical protein [Mycobacteriaceae bacterium]